MELKAEYTRETYRNYIIFYSQDDDIPESKKEEMYDIPMLLNNKIPYLLDVQINYLNERARYEYDITGNQAVSDWVERRKIKYKDCENLYGSIFGAIDASSEYLLDQSNLVLLPEYIYYELSKNTYRFIYHVHYHMDILKQMNELSEYLMDHVNYEDEKAVLLVYAMYHESKRKEASVDTLRAVFEEKKRLNEVGRSKKDTKEPEVETLAEGSSTNSCEMVMKSQESQSCKEDSNSIKNQDANNTPIRRQLVQRPIMEERQESEKLVSKYPMQSYSVVGITALVMLIVIVYSISQGLELKKLVAIILIVASITAYIASKMFDPKKKVEKMVPVVEYIKQPEMNAFNQKENVNLMKEAMKTPEETNYNGNVNNNSHMNSNSYANNSSSEYQNEGLSNNTHLSYINDLTNTNDLTNINAFSQVDNLSNNDELSDMANLYECTQLLTIVEEFNDIDASIENNNSPYVLLPEDDKYKPLKMLEFPFYIGKIIDGMDAVIMESTISRVHAKIIKEDEDFYITDMGSTNGTFINEGVIQPHSKEYIKLGDTLRFANVSYRFGILD